MRKKEKELEDIEYIVPKNYDIKPKILGIIEQEAFILFLIVTLIIFVIINSIIENIFIKLQIIIVITLPQIVILINGINGESIIYIVKYVLLYILRKKVYLYEKSVFNSL